MSKKNYVLKVIKTKAGWTIKSNHSLGSNAGVDHAERLKQPVEDRAERLASNLSKEQGVTVTVEIYSASGNLQSSVQW